MSKGFTREESILEFYHYVQTTFVIIQLFQGFSLSFSRNPEMNQRFCGWMKYKKESVMPITI